MDKSSNITPAPTAGAGRRRRLVRVERRALVGSRDQLTATLRASGKSGTIQTAYVERLNLTVRQAVAALSRRTWGVAHSSAKLMFHTTVEANAQRIFSNPGSPSRPLHEQYQKVTATMRRQEPGPEVVSRVVQQAMATPRPKARYVAGFPFSGGLVLHLGGSVWDLVVRQMVKIASIPSEWFAEMTLTHTDTGDTLLSGPVVDQAALHGLLAKIRDLNLILVALEQVDPAQPMGTQVWKPK